MPTNLPIAGGKDTPPPLGWNEAENGKCATINVLYRQGNFGPEMQTAWHFQPDEMMALLNGGAFYLTLPGERHPVITIAVTDQHGEMVGAAKGPADAADDEAKEWPALEGHQLAAAKHALIGMIQDLDTIAVAGGGMILGKDHHTVGILDWPAAAEAIAIAAVAADPAGAMEAIARMVSDDADAPLQIDMGNGDFMANFARLVKAEANVGVAFHPERGPQIEAAYIAAMDEVDRQADERGSVRDVGQIDPSGQIFLKGTFNLREIVEAAMRGAGDAGKPEPAEKPEMVSVPLHTLESIAIQAQVEAALKAPGAGKRILDGSPLIQPMPMDQGASDRARSVAFQANRGKHKGAMPMWVIYDSPSDFPGKHVARLWMINANGTHPTSIYVTAPTLEQCREEMHAAADTLGKGTLVDRFPRDDTDDANIVESWV